MPSNMGHVSTNTKYENLKQRCVNILVWYISIQASRSMLFVSHIKWYRHKQTYGSVWAVAV